MKSNNKGYSMVEMIIVIAIVSVLGVLGAMTMNIVYTAKATSACDKLNSQMNTLKTMTKAQSPDTAMYLYYDNVDERYCIRFGIVDSSNRFIPNADKERVLLSDRVIIYYKAQGASDNDESVIGIGGIIVQFNKSDGSVLQGAGEYRIAKTNKKAAEAAMNSNDTSVGSTVNTIKLNKNSGSITR